MIMERIKNFILLRLVKIISKAIFKNVVEFQNVANKKVIGMFPKRLFTNSAQCSLLKFNDMISVGVIGSTPYRNVFPSLSKVE